MMSTPTQTTIPMAPPPGALRATGSGLVPYRLTVRQFLKMIDADVFRDEDHVELLGGILVDKMKKYPPHNFGVRKLAALLRVLLPAGWFVDEEKPIQLSRWSRPEPDIAVIRGRLDDYSERDPTAAEVAIVAEVADSSYPKDRGMKSRKYAASKVPVYWIVNLPQRQVEVSSAPSGLGRAAAYQDVKIYGADDEVPLILEGQELGGLRVRDVLPLIVKS
jgi:Uma2 family endonuclease